MTRLMPSLTRVGGGAVKINTSRGSAKMRSCSTCCVSGPAGREHSTQLVFADAASGPVVLAICFCGTGAVITGRGRGGQSESWFAPGLPGAARPFARFKIRIASASVSYQGRARAAGAVDAPGLPGAGLPPDGAFASVAPLARVAAALAARGSGVGDAVARGAGDSLVSGFSARSTSPAFADERGTGGQLLTFSSRCPR